MNVYPVPPSGSETRAASTTPGRPLRVLLVEDSEDDAALVLRLLRRAGYEVDWAQVQTEEALEQALTQGRWDIVLSDYNMPQFDALRALRTLRGRSAHLPFIIISGSIGEETAVAAMRAGANDYVMKTNLPRLIPAVERELREFAERWERARTREALHDLQAKFQVVFHEFPDAMIVLDEDGIILHANRAVFRLLGHRERDLPGSPFATLWPRGQKVVVTTLLSAVREEGKVFFSGPFRRLDGTVCPMDLQANKVPWGQGEATIVTLRDVTERQRAEQRLNDEKEQLAVTLRSMGDGVITTDAAGRVVLLNGAAERLTGWRQGEARGRPLAEVLPLTCEDGVKPCEKLVQDALHGDNAASASHQVQLRNRAGRLYMLTLKAAPMTAHDGSCNGVVTVFRDVTVEQKVEEELQKASKLESVSLLAGGIAHDFNNILTAMLGHLSLAKATEKPSPQVLQSMERACLYATGLTRQLLSFAKGNDPVRRLENVGEILEESVLFALHGTNVTCCFDVQGDLWRAELDRGQVHQVLNNLVINAVQASPEGGALHVEAHNIVVGHEERTATLPAGNYVRITLRDSGKGIAPENLARIFDPYFTTKSTGSGLGLATSYSIVKKHNGLIRVDSEIGIGTTFTIYLPAKRNPASGGMEATAASPDKTNASAAGGRVLFMDDELILQELVAAMLGHLGYEVTCAANGEEALRLYREAQARNQKFDVVIVDLTVPGGMGGQETTRRLLEIEPEVKVVVSSGYSNDPIMSDYRRHGFSGVIAKPYQMEQLSRVLQEAMKG